LLLLLAVVTVVPVVLLLLDEVALLLLGVVVMAVVALLGQSVSRDGERNGGAGEDRDQGAKASHDAVTSQGSRMTTVIPYRQGALHVTPLSHRRDEDHTAVTRTLKRASYVSPGSTVDRRSWLASALVGAVIGSKQMNAWPSGAHTCAIG
jgi:hypothetical protein